MKFGNTGRTSYQDNVADGVDGGTRVLDDSLDRVEAAVKERLAKLLEGGS